MAHKNSLATLPYGAKKFQPRKRDSEATSVYAGSASPAILARGFWAILATVSGFTLLLM